MHTEFCSKTVMIEYRVRKKIKGHGPAIRELFFEIFEATTG
jgi:hypothetical protein